MSEYKSSVLRCYAGEDHCPVCRFIDGDESKETLLEVVRVMDEQLARSEDMRQKLLKGFVAKCLNSAGENL